MFLLMFTLYGGFVFSVFFYADFRSGSDGRTSFLFALRPSLVSGVIFGATMAVAEWLMRNVSVRLSRAVQVSLSILAVATYMVWWLHTFRFI